MNVPKLRFKEFNDEWQPINLADIFQYFSTNSLSREQLSESGILKNLHYGDIHRKYNSIVNENKEITSYVKDLNYVNKYELLKNNDLIFADASEDYKGIGKAVEVVNVNNNTVSGLHTILVRDNSNVFAPMFKGYYFNSPTVHNQIRVLANGFKVYGISKEAINKLNIKIPSIKEQSKIANTLYLLDKKIELQNKKIEGLKLFKKGLLKKQYNYIKNKNLVELSDIANIYQPQTIAQNKLDNGKYFVFGANGIIGKYSKYNHKQKQITISCRGENSGKVNITPEECWITGNSMVLNIDNNSNVDKLYLKCILDSQNLRYLISGSGQPQITRNVILKHKIPLLPILDQKKFRNPFIKLDLKILLEETKVNKLLNIKKGLMQNMFV